ncbi:MAG: BRcat domain-containing protein [Gemmataceae bacterium]
MPYGFPCPNPACPHVFQADAVRRSSALTCPSCGHVFQFRQKPKAQAQNRSSKGALPAQTPVKATAAEQQKSANTNQIKAKSVALASPVAAPAQSEPPVDALPLTFDSRPLVRLPKRLGVRRTWRPSRLLALLVIVGGLGGGLAAVFYQFRDQLDWDFFDSQAAQEAKSFNYRFRLPNHWTRHLDMELAMRGSGLKVRLAMRRNQPASMLAIVARDFEKEKSLPDANLLDEILRGLAKYFQNFEWQKKEDGSLGGREARSIAFQGDENGFTVKGECVMATHQGYAYWFLTWSPYNEQEEAQGEWVSIREGFEFLNRREGWTEKPRKRLAVSGTKAPFVLRYPDGLWEKQTLEGYDKAADLALLGTDPAPKDAGIRHDARRAATFQVLILPNEADLRAGIAALEKHLVNKQKEDNFPKTQLEAIEEDHGGIDHETNLGDMPGWVKTVRMKNSETRERFVLLAIAPLDDQMLAIIGECDWQRRAFWEQEFEDLLRNFERKKTKPPEPSSP